MSEPDYDPLDSERAWYRNKQTSDRGWLVRRAYKDAIRFDRGPQVDQFSFSLQDWEPLKEDLPLLSTAHVAKICFEADKALCWALGHVDLAKREWLDLSEKVRVKWIESGPLRNSPAHEQRLKLYQLIKGAL